MVTLGQPSSIQGQQAQIAQLQNRLNSINYQASVAVNNYDGAMWHLQTARHQIVENAAAITSNQAQFARSQGVLATRLREIYATPTRQLCALKPAPKLTSHRSAPAGGGAVRRFSSKANSTEGLLMLPLVRNTRVLDSSV